MLNNLIDWIIQNGGLFILLFVIFAETGLFVGFFLPGDSLLFAAGIKMDKLAESVDKFLPLSHGLSIIIIIVCVIVASFLGNMAGFWFGYKAGPMIYHRKETWLFRKRHLRTAEEFYHKKGNGTIFLAKFLPIIRTFAPIVAGIVKMERAPFILYNLLGSIAWVSSMMLGGYFLDSWITKRFGFSLASHIEVIAIGIILVTTLPVLYKLFFGKKAATDETSSRHE